jgi:hypothetical protein
MTRERSSAAEGKLFSHEMIDPSLRDDTSSPLRFVGSIRGVNASSHPLLKRALEQPLSLGRGRAHGWGRVQVTLATLPAPLDIGKRATAFKRALSDHLTAAGLEAGLAGQLIPFTLLSPMLVPQAAPDRDDGSEEIARVLGAAFDSWFLKVRRFGVEVGWDQRSGRRPACRSVVAGSIFIARLKSGVSAQLLTDMNALEERGAGERTKEGFGRILCFDPFFLERRFVNQEQKKEKQDMAESRREAVLAAERVVEKARINMGARGQKRWLELVEKNQVSTLVSVTREATCAEEIENWLRYQVGREKWPDPLVKEMVEEVQKLYPKNSTDEVATQAWRDFSIYFVRAYTYARKVDGGGAR